MAQQIYTNNAKSTLASGISSTDTTITLVAGGVNALTYLQWDDPSYFQVCTLIDKVTNEFEIISVVAAFGSTNTLTVVRGHEYTAAKNWPAGTVIESRITAGTMRKLIQNEADTYDSVAIGGVSNSDGFGVVAIGRYSNARGQQSVSIGESAIADGSKSVSIIGWAAKNRSTAINGVSITAANGWGVRGVPHLYRDDWFYPYDFSAYNGPDTTCTTPFVDLGNGVPWSAGSTYTDGAVVVPIVPNGLQYHLYHGEYNPDAQPNTITTGNAEPVWPLGDGDSVEDTGSSVYAEWICVDVSANGFSMDIPSDFVFYPAEIGFICFNYANVTAPPSISVGTTEDPTLFVNNQPLGNITGAQQRHGFTGFKHGVSTAMKFKASTPAAGVNSQFHGRFYIKGTFVQKQG